MSVVDEPAKRYVEPRFSRALNLPHVEFLFSDHDQNLWHVYHERYVLCACEQTSNTLRYRGKVEELFDGSMLLMEPGEAHRNLSVPRPSHFRVVFIEPEHFRRAASDYGLRATPHFARTAVDHPELTKAVYRLCASVEAQDMVLEQQSHLAKCLWLALPHTETAPPTADSIYPNGLLKAKAYIAERYNQAIALDDLAACGGMSPYHLIAVSRDILGCRRTPIKSTFASSGRERCCGPDTRSLKPHRSPALPTRAILPGTSGAS